jgi:diguanylate cyclase (GGDEF)-like protein/PAS domain S-box-containing protein
MQASRVAVYLQEATKRQVDVLAKKLNKSRSSLIASSVEFLFDYTQGLPLDEIELLLEKHRREKPYSAWWYRELTENSPVLLWASDTDKQYHFFNKAWLDFTGRSLDSLIGNGWLDDVHPDDVQQCMEQYHAAFESQSCFDTEYQLRRFDGEYRWFINTAAPYFDDSGIFRGYIGSCLDITPRKQLEATLHIAASSIVTLDDGVMITDASHTIIWINSAFTKITGYILEDVKGNKPSVLRSGKHSAEFYEHMLHKISNGDRWQGEICNLKKNGDFYTEWLSINCIKDDHGRIVNYVGIFSDITKQKEREEHMRYQFTHDYLTGLANRNLLEQTLEFSILNSKRSKRGIAILFIDLDSFKMVNDRFGHLVGDDVLKDVAHLINQSTRESDLAARLGGDEFIVILDNLTNVENAIEVAKKIAVPVATRIDSSIFVTFSIGISFYQGDGDVDVKTIIGQADSAMYQAKYSGKNAIRVYRE